MFYTIVQRAPPMGLRQGERFLCVEAGSLREATERAAYFGFDMGERFQPSGTARFIWSEDTPSDRPLIGGMPIGHHYLSGPWAILYLSGNLLTAHAVEFEV